MEKKKIKILIVLVLLALFYGNDNSILCVASSQNYNPTIKPHISCLTNIDCGSREVCHNNVCEPCRLEGEFSPDLTLCCEGLNRLNVDSKCVFVCGISDGCFPAFDGKRTSSEIAEQLLGYILGFIGLIFLFIMIIAIAVYAISPRNKKKIPFLKRIFTIATVGFVVSLFAILCLMNIIVF